MSKSKHTPGPWKAVKQSAESMHTVESELCNVAHVPEWSDARLISVAPELLSILEQLVKVLIVYKENKHILDLAVYTISKAKGEQP